MPQPLSFADELILLAVDDDTGRMHPIPDKVLGSALGAALLFELSARGERLGQLAGLELINQALFAALRDF